MEVAPEDIWDWHGEGDRLFIVKSDNIAAAVAAVNAGAVDGLMISDEDGFNGKDLTFLADAPDIKNLWFDAGGRRVDANQLAECRALEALWIGDFKKPVDLSGLSALKLLSLPWHQKTVLPPAATPLEAFTLRGWAWDGEGECPLPRWKSLTGLGLMMGKLRTLENLHGMSQLETLDLYRCSPLQRLAIPEDAVLGHLSMESSRRIEDWESVGNARKLEHFVADKCNDFPDLEWASNLTMVQHFAFVGMKVTSLDVSPLLQLRSPKWVGFEDRRGYSHTLKEVWEAVGIER